ERQVPELDRNVAPLLPLRDDPLHDETRREDELPGETDDEPEVPDHVVTGCRLPVTGATRGQRATGNWQLTPHAPCNPASACSSTARPGNRPVRERRGSSRRTSRRRTFARDGSPASR